MPEEWRWYLGNRDLYLRDRAEELQQEISSAHSAASRLSSQLRKVQGTLEQRVDRLASAFDAFIELSDLRTELTAFGDAFTVRRLVREIVLDGIQPHDVEPAAQLPEVPGYWLVPATRALLPLADGDETGAAQPLHDALALDGPRTRLFLTVALAVTDRQAAACRWFGETLGDLSGTVTNAQRQLWLAAAGGVFGDAGRRLLTERIRAAVDALPPERRTHLAGDWSERIAHLPKGATVPVPRQLTSTAELRRPIDAAATLAALRQHCAQVFDPTPAAEEPSDVMPVSQHPVAGLLADLVDEGSPDEAPVLRRAAELREVIESNGQAGAGRASRPHWYATSGELTDLLTADMLGTEDADPVVRATALRAAAPELLPVVDRLAAAAAEPAISEATVSIGSTRVRLTGDGPYGSDVDALERDLAAAAKTSHTKEIVAYAVAGVGVLVALSGIAAGVTAVVVGVVLAVAGAAFGGYATVARRGVTTERAEWRTRMLADLDRAQQAFRSFAAASASAGPAAKDHAAGVRTLLEG